jgi:hypothetical protein
MFIGYLETHENDVYKFMNSATKKTMMSRDVIWLNKTYFQHVEITQVDFVSSEMEYEEVEYEEKGGAEQEGDNHLDCTRED